MEMQIEQGTSPEAEKSAHLSPTSAHAQPKFPTPSLRSVRSDTTIVQEQSDTERSHVNSKPKRAETRIVEAKISWWTLFVGLFRGTKYAGRRIIVDAYERPDVEDESRNEPYNYIHTVHVKTSGTTDQTEEEGRCNFDTGCLQGNIVSLAFVEKLGFTSSDFKALTHKEKFGGTSATGHPIDPIGALKLTWYHESSVKIFSNMRFLVIKEANYDLIVGSDSLYKHKLMGQVNFDISDKQPDYNVIKERAKPKREELRKKESELKNKALTLEKAMRGLDPTDKKRIKLQSELNRLQKEHAIAKTELELYDERNDDPNNPKRKKDPSKIADLEKKLKDLKEGPADQGSKKANGKKDDTLTKQISPDVTVSEPSGRTRVATGMTDPPKHN